jgi:hypothetical protein
MTVTNKVTKEEINLKDLPFDLLEEYVMTNIDEESILNYFDPEDFQKDLSTKEILDLIYENIGYFNTSEINELSKEVTYYSKDRILPNNNIMDQFKSDFIINNWERLTLNKLEGLLNE